MSKAQLLAKSKDPVNEQRLPLNTHLSDIAGVARRYIKECISEAAIKATGLDKDTLEKVTVFSAAVHDIGKAASFFQDLLTQGDEPYRDGLKDTGYNVSTYDRHNPTPHAWAGHDILELLGVPASIAAVVGAHHGRPYTAVNKGITGSLIDIAPGNFYGRPAEDKDTSLWKKTWERLIKNALKTAKLTPGKLKKIRLSPEAQNLISAIIINADWIVSNTNWLEPTEKHLYVKERIKRTDIAWACADLPGRFTAEAYTMDSERFRKRFGFTPNAMQEAVLDTVNSALKPGLYMLNATMGLGKTEAALAAVEVLCTRLGCTGTVFGLPTQATANGIFTRFAAWADSLMQETGSRNTISLAHGARNVNDDFIKYMDASPSAGKSDEPGLSVNPWFSGSHKSLLPDFIVGTVDQILTSSLKQKYYMLKHLGLAGKVVVIDECHAYDAYMDHYLGATLSWCGAYGIPVVMMSATLPANKRRDFIEAYRKAYIKYNASYDGHDPVIDEGWDTSNGYPLLTWTENGDIHQTEVDMDQTAKDVTVRIGSDDYVNILASELSDGGCAAVIVNTVKKAQELKAELRAAFPDKKIFLYHSRYTSSGRATKEKMILEHFGKKSVNRDGLILIGTQVLEQSLDYDVDIMLSQICPMDLLLQRVGRLHRHSHRNSTRPDRLKTPKLYVMNADRGTNAVYGRYLINMTEKHLPSKITIPEDIPGLVEAVYGKDDPSTEGYMDHIALMRDKEAHARIWCLERKHVQRKLIDGLLDFYDDELDEMHARAAVRDGNPAAEVILIKKSGDYAVLYNEEDTAIRLDSVPSDKDIRKIMKEAIKLPAVRTGGFNTSDAESQLNELKALNGTLLSAWTETPWLKDRAFLVMDEEDDATVSGKIYSYSKENGLIELQF